MNDRDRHAGAGWVSGQSMALELDVALTAMGGYFLAGGLPEDFVAMVRSIPSGWQADWANWLGNPRHLIFVLESAAYLAGVLLEADYSRATLAMRELSVEAALARLAGEAGLLGLAVSADLSPAEGLVELGVQLVMAGYARAGFEPIQKEQLAGRLKQDMARAARILQGGEWHDRFWHWLDRFYYEYYRPWRQSRADLLVALEKQVGAVLGAPQQADQPPDLAWLPAQNPLLRYPELQAAVLDGRLQLFFWVEPFGLADTWSIWPGLVIVSLAQAGALYTRFHDFAGDVATRTKALADPTRLIILRLIRHFGMINTDIAAYLGLARPTVSVHAKILREAGLIRSRQEGRLVRHEIVPEEVRRLFQDLAYLLDLPGEDD